MTETKTINLKNRPNGIPDLQDFEFTTTEVPELKVGEVLLSSKYVSVDPYLRGRMTDAPSYVPPFEIGKPIESGIIAEVVESKHDDYKEGDYLSGRLPWKETQVA
ncbi:MAG TPA: hypothetical protein VJ894_00265, partial [Cryomorphaceae bacterium]|nr:hypothetical protein [Cryomorphaceae bacterium]